MRRLALCLGILCFALNFFSSTALVVSAEEAQVETTQQAQGEISTVNPDEGTVIVTSADAAGAQESWEFDVTESTEILKGDQEAQIDDLASGDKVSIEFMVNPDGQNVAKTLKVMTN